MLRLGLVALFACVLVGVAVLGAQPARADRERGSALATGGQEAGTHVRMETDNGPVHVWMPPGYEPETAGIVLYVHGYYTDVDDAWEEHRLAEQFLASGRNALFIVPEAPRGNGDRVRFADLGALIRLVRAELGLVRPWGPVVAVGHSGAYRTLVPWLRYRLLSRVILIDGLYAEEEPFRRWLMGSARRRLTLVAIDTLRWSEPLARELGAAYSLDWVPAMGELGSEAVRRIEAAQLFYLRSQYGHMELVTEGKTMPVLLQLSELPSLPR